MNIFKRPHSSLSKKSKNEYSTLFNANIRNNSKVQDKEPSSKLIPSAHLTPKRVASMDSYLDHCHSNKQEKREKIRKDQYNDLINNIKRVPDINSNSRIIAKKLNYNILGSEMSRKYSYTQESQTHFLTQTSVCDYMEIMNNRMKKIKEKDMLKSLKEGNSKNGNKNIKIKTINKTKVDEYKPVIMKDSKWDFNGYIRYDEKAVKNVRNKIHQYYDKKFHIAKKIENNKDYKKDNSDEEKKFISSNNNTNETYYITFNPIAKNDINFNKDNDNDNDIDINKEKDENNFKCKSNKLEISKIEEPDSKENINMHIGNYNILSNNNKTKIPLEVIGQRESDLKKFIIFTEGISLNNNKSKNKNKEPKDSNIKISKENQSIDNKEINVNEFKIENNDNLIKDDQLKSSTNNQMKLNPNSKAFLEEKLKQMKEKMEKNK